MIDVDKTRLVLDQIAHAKDPLGLVRELVLASGGTWIDSRDRRHGLSVRGEPPRRPWLWLGCISCD